MDDEFVVEIEAVPVAPTYDELDDYDAHSCSAEADEYGICSVCGAIVRGTLADYELHGYDPFDTY